MGIDVLVVDDDPDIRATLTELLRDEGYRVEGVASTTGFCVVLEQERPRIVLLDLTLPGQDLGSVLAEARERHLLTDTVLLALSGLDDALEIAAQLKLDGAVRKPFDINELLQRVEQVCRAEPVQEPAEPPSAYP